MKPLLWGLALLLAVAAGAILSLPLIVNEAAISNLVQARLRAHFGEDLGIAGGLQVRLYPRPVLTLQDVRWSGTLRSGVPLDVRAARIELDLGLASLVRGEVDPVGLSLIRPDIELGELRPVDLADTLAESLADAPDLTTISIDDGQVTAPLDLNVGGDVPQPTGPAERQFLLDAVTLGATIDPASRTIEVTGSASLGGQRLDVSLTALRHDAGGPAPFKMRLRTPDSRIETSLTGIAGTGPDGPSLDVSVTGHAARLADAARLIQPYLPDEWTRQIISASEARIDAHLQGDPSRWQVDRLALGLGGITIEGTAAYTPATKRGDADLQVRGWHLDRGDLPEAETLDMLARALNDVAIGARLRLTDTSLGAFDLREMRADIDWHGGRSVDVRQLEAVLPGNGRLALRGKLTNGRLVGDINLDTADLQALLATLNASPASPAPGRPRLVSLQGKLDADEMRATVSDARIRLDDSQGTATLALTLAPERHVAARLHLDRLALDEYGSLGGAGSSRLPVPFDVDLDVDRATWGVLQLGPVRAAARVSEDAARLDNLQLQDFAGLRLSIAPPDDAGHHHAVFAIQQPSRLARALGYDRLAQAMATAGPISGTGDVATTTSGGATVELDGRAAAWSLHAFAASSNVAAGGFDATVAVHAGDGTTMLGDFGMPVTILPHDAMLAQPLAANVSLTRDRQDAPLTLESTITLEDSTAGARVALLVPPDLARHGTITGTVHLNGEDPAVLGEAGRLLASSLGLPTGPAAAWVGRWPTDPLLPFNLGRLPAAVIDVSAKEGSAKLRLDGDRLEIQDLDWPVLRGEAQGQLAVHADGDTYGLTTDMKLRGANLEPLLGSLRIQPPWRSDHSDLDLSATTRGRSVEELLAGVNGSLRFRSAGGDLPTSPSRSFASLDGVLRFSDGAAVLEDGEVKLTDGDVLPLGGTLDLPRWRMQVELGDQAFEGSPGGLYPP